MKKTHIIGLIVVALGLGAIFIMSGQNSSYETFQTAIDMDGHTVHVIGKLEMDKDITYDPIEDPNYFSFYMLDDSARSMKVVYNGAKPTDFERSERIVVKGKVVGQEFHAKDILMKCPSKYVDDEIKLKEAGL